MLALNITQVSIVDMKVDFASQKS